MAGERPRGGRAEAPKPEPITFRPTDEDLERWLSDADALVAEVLG